VITIAKRDLRSGEVLDGVGGFTCYGMIENANICHAENLLPMGLSEECNLTRDIRKDQAITYAGVKLPQGRLCNKLRNEQDAYFATI
jgi:predicted homoserine dehydrogenase-like protein